MELMPQEIVDESRVVKILKLSLECEESRPGIKSLSRVSEVEVSVEWRRWFWERELIAGLGAGVETQGSATRGRLDVPDKTRNA